MFFCFSVILKGNHGNRTDAQKGINSILKGGEVEEEFTDGCFRSYITAQPSPHEEGGTSLHAPLYFSPHLSLLSLSLPNLSLLFSLFSHSPSLTLLPL